MSGRKRPAAAPDDDGLLVLCLYVAGNSPNSLAARANLEAVLERHEIVRVELELVDVLTHPERGLRDGVLVTPTLVKLAPAPLRRVIGSLRDETALLATLDLPRRPRA